MPALDFEARRAWFVDRVCALHADGNEIWCAFSEEDGALAGFFALGPEGYVDQIVVRASLWGKGVAVAILDDAKRRSNGVLLLDVNQDNSRAVRFYEREGFDRTGEGINPLSGLKTWRYAWQALRRG